MLNYGNKDWTYHRSSKRGIVTVGWNKTRSVSETCSEPGKRVGSGEQSRRALKIRQWLDGEGGREGWGGFMGGAEAARREHD